MRNRSELTSRRFGHRRTFSKPQLFLLLVLPFFAVSGCDRQPAAQTMTNKGPAAVMAIAVSTRDVPVSFEFVGQVRSSREVNIQARVDGFLERRVYTEGAVVREGDVLFVMDRKPFEVRLRQAEAALARQEASLEVARRELARVKPLTEADALSQKDLDDATGQFESAAAAVEQAKANVEQAKLELSYTVIRSPVTGITGEAEQADGTYLNPANSQLTTVAVLSPTYVNFSLSENEWLRYRKEVAQKQLMPPPGRNYITEIVLADGSVYPKTGRLTFAAPSFDPQTGTFLVRSTVDNPDGLLRPNQYVRIRLKGAVRPNAVTVPQRAVQQGPRGHFVWVVNPAKKAESRPVVIGDWVGGDIVITEGLRAGDRVIVDGGLALQPGAPVRVKPESGPAGETVAKPVSGGRG